MDTKIVLIVADDIQTWQKLNVVSFLVSGLIGNNPVLMGDDYIDAGKNTFNSLSKQPMIVLKASRSKLKTIHGRTISKNIKASSFISDMFSTNNDIDNREVFRNYSPETADVVGVGVYCDSKTADKITKGAKLHD